jgi:hypothetical protein
LDALDQRGRTSVREEHLVEIDHILPKRQRVEDVADLGQNLEDRPMALSVVAQRQGARDPVEDVTAAPIGWVIAWILSFSFP